MTENVPEESGKEKELIFKDKFSGPTGEHVKVQNERVAEAWRIFQELDRVPVTGNERTEVEKALGRETPATFTQPLLERIERVTGQGPRLSGTVAARYGGTWANTSLLATPKGGHQVDATGYNAVHVFGSALGEVPKEERHEVVWRVTVETVIPKYPLAVQDTEPWAGEVGEWLEVFVHEFTLHAETYVNAIGAYLAGAVWPTTFQSTEHWLFVQQGLPRYLLLLHRIRQKYPAHENAYMKSLRPWALTQTKVPPAVANVVGGNPNIENLRELALFYGKEQPAEVDMKLSAWLKERLAPLVTAPPLDGWLR
ncbi:hypothetical protein ABGB17_30440 [Sphaerisporangium sp. B11E5]|uniref:hypothetical protein n=1 Tax=Sphaerisporangium sp. B11E5 TaxID=3153563 RepID=UPI00325EEE76